MEKFTTNNKIRGVVIALLWLGLWQFAAVRLDEEILLVSPLSVFGRILREGGDPEFWKILGNTALHILAGWIGGGLLGFLIALLSFYNDFLKAFFRPMTTAIQATPIVSFIILILLWVPVTGLSSVISGLIVFPLFYRNTLSGLESVGREYLDMAKVFRWGERKKWKYLYLPALKPFLGSAMLTGIGLAWKAGLAAEVIGLPKGTVGERIQESKVFLDTEGLFAYTIVAVILSFLMEKGVKALWTGLPSER